MDHQFDGTLLKVSVNKTLLQGTLRYIVDLQEVSYWTIADDDVDIQCDVKDVDFISSFMFKNDFSNPFSLQFSLDPDLAEDLLSLDTATFDLVLDRDGHVQFLVDEETVPVYGHITKIWELKKEI